MPYTFNSATKSIVLPIGDTMTINVTVTGYTFDAIVFAIYDRDTGEDLLLIPMDIDADGNASIRLSNELTRSLEPGRYKWNLRLVTDPERDEYGNIIAEDANDDVVTVFGPDNGSIPDMKLVDNGGRV